MNIDWEPRFPATDLCLRPHQGGAEVVRVGKDEAVPPGWVRLHEARLGERLIHDPRKHFKRGRVYGL